MKRHFALIALSAAAGTAQASWYPPDYVVESECKQDAGVKVCMFNHRVATKPYLRIEYTGQLQPAFWGRLSVYVRINGRDATFPLTNANYTDYVQINHYRNIRLCYHNTTMTPTTPQFEFCPNASPEGPMVLDYYKEMPPQTELDLVGNPYDEGNRNGWNVELAFVSQDGQWDSRYGSNYRFRFNR